MDQKRFKDALSINPDLAIEAFSDEEILAAVAKRHLDVSGVVGPVATESTRAEAPILNPENIAFQAQISRFLDVDTRSESDTDHSVMVNFWDRLGYEVPKFSEAQSEQHYSLTADVAPFFRVVPVPLLSIFEIRAIADKAREFLENQFSPTNHTLKVQEDDDIHHQLLRKPDGVIEARGKKYGQCYKTTAGEIVSRTAYIDSLKRSDQVVTAEDGTVWTFPLMDVRVRTPKTNDYVRNIYELVNPIVTTESLIAVQLLHQANGTPSPESNIDFANKAIYELDEEGRPKNLVSVAGVFWRPQSHQILMHYWPVNSQKSELYRVREGMNGL